MDIREITNTVMSDEFREMSDEEKRNIVRELIHIVSKDTSNAGVLLNPRTHKMSSMTELIEEVGEDKLVDILIEAILEGRTATQFVTNEMVTEALKRKQEGTATERDEQLLKAFKSVMDQTEAIQINKNFLTVIVELVEFIQKDRKYDVTMGDLLASMNVMGAVTAMFSNGSNLENYNSFDTGHEIISQVSKSIVEKFESSVNTMPDDYTMMCAYLEAAQRHANNIKCLDSEQYRDILGSVIVQHEDEEDCDHCEDCEYCGNCHASGNENGSNMARPNVYNPNEDDDMRNMLKD